MAKKDCTRCGQCCIVCTDIQLTREEVREGLFAKRQRNRPITGNPPDGWSKWIIMRGAVYEPKLKREIFACVYWDPLTRDCVIYADRPTVCKMYDCYDMLNQTAQTVSRIWASINKGKQEALCLEA